MWGLLAKGYEVSFGGNEYVLNTIMLMDDNSVNVLKAIDCRL